MNPGIIGTRLFEILNDDIQCTSSLCPTVKSPVKSTCKRCKEFCPYNSIKFENGIQLDKNCTSCGLCVTACPNGVFLPARETDNDIQDRALRLLKKANPKISRFACSMRKSEKGAVRIECLGRINENILLTLLLKGAESFEFKGGKCEECSLRTGKGLFYETVNLTQFIVKTLGYHGEMFREVEEFTCSSERENEVIEDGSEISRREFFKKLSLKTFLGISDSWEKFHKDIGVETKKEAANDKRKVLIRLLQILQTLKNPQVEEVAHEQPTFPFAKVVINDACTGCDVCQLLCPTSAIRKIDDDGNVSLVFSYQQCTNCKLCEIVCLPKAIKIVESLSVQDLLKGEEEELIRLKKNTCKRCKREFVGNDREYCLFCLKKTVKII